MQNAAFLAVLMGAAQLGHAEIAHAQSARAQGPYPQGTYPATQSESLHPQPAYARRATAELQSGSPVSAPARRLVPVAAHDIRRGTVLAAADIAWSDSAVVSPDDSFPVHPGWVARREFRAGEPLDEPGVSRPDLVTSGDLVDVIYSAGGVTIQVRGTAIGSGGRGDHVYVKLENRRRLRAIVSGTNTVKVM